MIKSGQRIAVVQSHGTGFKARQTFDPRPQPGKKITASCGNPAGPALVARPRLARPLQALARVRAHQEESKMKKRLGGIPDFGSAPRGTCSDTNLYATDFAAALSEPSQAQHGGQRLQMQLTCPPQYPSRNFKKALAGRAML